MSDIIKSKQRNIKITEVGDFWKRKTKPQLLLQGKWLAEAGFPPNNRVCINNPEPGLLVIRLINEQVY